MKLFQEMILSKIIKLNPATTFNTLAQKIKLISSLIRAIFPIVNNIP